MERFRQRCINACIAVRASIIVDVVHSTVVIEHPTVDIAVPFPRLQRLYKSEEKKTKERIK